MRSLAIANGSLRQRRTRRRVLTCAIGLIVFATIFVAREFVTGITISSALFVIPIALFAQEFGWRSGLLAAATGTLLMSGWIVAGIQTSSIAHIGIRIVTFFAIAGLVGWLSDRALREADLARSVLEAMPQPASVKDASGRYIMVNSAFTDRVHSAAGEIIGRCEPPGRPSDINRQAHEAEKLVFATREPVEYEVHGSPQGGDGMTMFTVKAPVLNSRGDVTAIVTIAYDISNRVEHERQVVEAAAIEQSAYKRARADYTRLMHHRVANPLAILRASAETLRTSYGDEPQHRQQLADLMTDACRRLEQLELTGEVLDETERDLHPTVDDCIVGSRSIANADDSTRPRRLRRRS